jgi:hypothetical protein
MQDEGEVIVLITREVFAVSLLRKALQKNFSTGCDVVETNTTHRKAEHCYTSLTRQTEEAAVHFLG